MEYKETTKQHGLLIKKIYKQENSEITNLKKGKVRKDINNNVFDPEDSIADNNKLITLLMTILMKLYNVGFDISQLPDDDRFIIESWIELFTDTTTRFSLQFQKEGYALLVKLLNRQQQVADYISETYSDEGEES